MSRFAIFLKYGRLCTVMKLRGGGTASPGAELGGSKNFVKNETKVK